MTFLHKYNMDIEYIRLIDHMREYGEHDNGNVECEGYKLQVDLKEYKLPILTIRNNDDLTRVDKMLTAANSNDSSSLVKYSNGDMDKCFNHAVDELKNGNDLTIVNNDITCTFKIKNKKLTCIIYQVECDLNVALPQNITFYSILTYILSHKCDLLPDKLIYTVGTIYSNSLDLYEREKEMTNFFYEPRTLTDINGKLCYI